MRRCAIWLWLCLLMLPSWVLAVDIQYRLDAEQAVTGVSDVPLDSVAGYGLVTLVGQPASAIQWPVPTGCAAGTGRPAYTRLTDPNTVDVNGTSMAVRSGLLFFHTTSTLLPGCHQVSNWGQLKRLMDQALIQALAGEELVAGLAPLQAWFMALCINVDAQGDLNWSSNSNCVAWQASLSTINARYPSRVQGAALAADMATLIQDGYNFKSSQGW